MDRLVSFPKIHFYVHGPEMKEIAESLDVSIPYVFEYMGGTAEKYSLVITAVEKTVNLDRPQQRCIDNRKYPSYDAAMVLAAEIFPLFYDLHDFSSYIMVSV